MKKLLIFYFQILIFTQINYSFGQKESFDSGIDLYDTSEELVPLRKTSETIGKCCQLGKAMSKLSGGMSDVYLTQSELNEDGTYTPMVQRLDTGAIVPMTQNRTAESDDMIVTLDRATLNRQLRGRWEEGITKGGLINNQGILAAYDPGTYRADYLLGKTKGAVLENAANIPQLANDPKSKTEFAAMINSIDDINELGSYYEAINGEGSFQEFQAAAEEEAKDAFIRALFR